MIVKGGEVSEFAAETVDQRVGPRFRVPSHHAVVAAGFAVVLLASLAAIYQRPAPDPLQPPRGASWWRYPLERNAFLRLPATGPIVRFAREPGNGRLYGVGRGGLILASADDGRTWTREPVRWQEGAAAPAAPVPPALTAERNRPDDDVHLASVEQAPSSRQQQQQQVPPAKGYPDDKSGAPNTDPLNTRPINSDPADAFIQSVPNATQQRVQVPAQPVTRAAANLRDIAFAADGRAWAVGESGTVIARSAGGAWEQLASAVADRLESVAVSADGAVLCAGTISGVLYRSDDGGRSWNPFLSHSGSSISAIVRIDGASFWAVSNDALLMTDDGCQSWRVQHRAERVNDVYASADRGRGWMVAARRVWTTTDSGDTWDPATPEFDAGLRAVYFADDERGWVTDDRGRVHVTTDGGVTWNAQDAGGGPVVTDVIEAGSRLFGGTDDEGFFVSDDDGATWRPGNAPDIANVIFLGDGRRGWAVGRHGFVARTLDSGATWETLPTGRSEGIHDAMFLDDGDRGWIVGDDGLILATSDGGSDWSRINSPDPGPLLAVWFAPDGRSGSVVGRNGLWSTEDGGSRWTRRSPAGTTFADRPLRTDRGWLTVRTSDRATLLFTDNAEPIAETRLRTASTFGRQPGGSIWALGPNGYVATAGTPLGEWTARTSLPAATFASIAFSNDGALGWMNSRDLLLASQDRGRSWTPAAGAPSGPWTRVAAAGEQGVVAVSPGARMYRGTGPEWAAIEHAVYPAPWYYIVVLLGLGLIGFVGLYTPEQQEGREPSVADVFVSDAPLEREDQDALLLSRLSGGIARFLANEKTEPPITLAITGEWGTGKTSLMNLVRERLRIFRFRTVWFNAWHHQTEEHLLGALLESLRRDALPPWWRPRGFAVRVRLLLFRGGRHAVPAALLLFAFFVAAGYVLQDLPGSLSNARAWVSGLLGSDKSGLTADNSVDLLSLLFAAGGLVPLLKNMQAFGASTKRVGSALSAYDPLRELRLPTGFRHRFAQAFNDVTRALAPQELVIFIDDLDRCHPQNVVATLEMVNFLVSSGRCYVILGMARERVERCVGLGFKDLAELGGEDQGADAQREAWKRRDHFARQYLEKLINIEIPVPTANAVRARGLITAATTPRTGDGWQGWVLPAAQVAAAALMALGICYGGYLSGSRLFQDTAGRAAREARSQSASDAPAGGAPVSASAPLRTDRAAASGSDEGLPAVFFAGADDRPWWPPALLAIAVGLIMAAPRLTRVAVHVEQDSPAFTGALNRWFPLVHASTPNPRAIKRFLNRVRFYAMSQRESAGAEGPGSIAAIPEPSLVALSVVQHWQPSVLKEAFWKSPTATIDVLLRDAASGGATEPSLMAQDLADAAGCRDEFLYMSRGITA